MLIEGLTDWCHSRTGSPGSCEYRNGFRREAHAERALVSTVSHPLTCTPRMLIYFGLDSDGGGAAPELNQIRRLNTQTST